MQQIRATELSRDFLRMMTKRRAESSSPYETPAQKKKCRTECDAEPELEAVHALHASTAAASPPGLFSTLIGERRRKRPRYCEDHEQHARAGLPGHTLSNATGSVNKETGDGCVSGKFRRASEVTSKESTSGSKLEERLQVATLHNVLVICSLIRQCVSHHFLSRGGAGVVIWVIFVEGITQRLKVCSNRKTISDLVV